MLIVVAPDKFKGSLSALEAADAICLGIGSVFPNARFHKIPLADGGEGTAEVFTAAAGGVMLDCDSTDALGRPISARYGWIDAERRAVIEMCAASGLVQIDPADRSPLHASTLGTGALMLDAVRRGAETIVIGLGGSGTNDAGAGAAAAFGWQFLDGNGHPVDPVPANFHRIARIAPPSAMPVVRILAVSDVGNPLLGPRGSSRVYGPQKGASADDIERLESALAHLAGLVHRDLGCDHRGTPGAGAAGGLGFGLLSFFNASIRPGFETYAELTGIAEVIAQCDLVVTGEGRLDSQTLEGKGPCGIAKLARSTGKPVVALAGSLADEEALGRVFDACVPIVGRPMSVEESMTSAASLLTLAAMRAARLMLIGKLL